MTPTRKLISLPSGPRVKIRKLSSFDFYSLPKEMIEDKTKVDGLVMTKLILTHCAGQIRFSETDRRRIVDKHFDDADDLTEITIEELDQADAQAIVDEVMALSPETEQAEPKA